MRKFGNALITACIVAAVAIALIVSLVAVSTLLINQGMFTKSLDDTIDLFKSSITSVAPTDNNASSATTSVSPTDNRTNSAVCVDSAGNIVSSTTSAVLADSANADEVLEVRMQYLEKLSELHKQATNRDSFVFLYELLSSVLVGLGAYMIKRGQDQLKELSKRSKDINAVADEVKKRLAVQNKTIKALSQKSDDINAAADRVKELLTVQDNAIELNFVSQVLSDAFISISAYNGYAANENLVHFKQSLNQVARWFNDKIDVSRVDKITISKFGQRLGVVKGLYARAAARDDTEIDDVHKRYIYADFKKIEDKLRLYL